MRKIVIYGGRFHPFHKGHKSVYDHLVKKYGATNVYIVSSNSQAPLTSPFSFDDKKQMMLALGVPADHIVQVKNPYQSTEVTEKFDPKNTAIIFAVSEKDSNRFSFKPKKDGTPSYMQPVKPNGLEGFDTHGYIDIIPTISFDVLGKPVNSATQIRDMYMGGGDETRMQIITDLYGEPNEKIKSIFDKKLTVVESAIKVLLNYRSLALTESAIPSKTQKLVETILKLEEMVV